MIALFIIALGFAALFVLSSLVGFLEMLMTGNLNIMLDPFSGHWTHASSAIGMVGWIATSYVIVRVDER